MLLEALLMRRKKSKDTVVDGILISKTNLVVQMKSKICLLSLDYQLVYKLDSELTPHKT